MKKVICWMVILVNPIIASAQHTGTSEKNIKVKQGYDIRACRADIEGVLSVYGFAPSIIVEQEKLSLYADQEATVAIANLKCVEGVR